MDNRNNPDQNGRTRQIPTQKPAEQTRQIPVQRGTQNAPGEKAPVRQNPAAARPTAPQANANGQQTRQIPAQRSTAVGRPTPVARPVSERQTPPSGTAKVSRPTPVGKPAPAVRPTPKSVSGETVRNTDPNATAAPQTPSSAKAPAEGTRQIPVQKSEQAPAKSPADGTRQIPAVASAAPEADDNTGTKIMKTAVEEAIPDPRKKKSRLAKAEEDAGGNTIVSIIKAVVYIVTVLVISIGVSLFIILVGNDVYAFVKNDTVVDVTVPEGADIDDIAAILSDSGVIKYPKIFKWYADHNNDDGKFIAGKYSIASNLDYEDLLASFKEQYDEGTTWVTVPEGFTTDEIIDLMVENGIGTKEGYIDVINNYPFDYWFVHELDDSNWQSTGRFYRLDGYLFPDTYEFYNESSERAVIEKFLARFSVIYGKKYREAAETMGMTTDEIVTIASMIEKEAGKAADYHLVSSVFHNRLKSEWYPRLESDATALYAIHHDTGERPTDVTGEHMEYATPYNTYLNDGLPPGPIANPSASSLNAALTPEETNYYYFVSYGSETYFSSTKGEHDGYIAMIKQMIADANAAPQE